MPSAPLRILVIGAGSIGERHTRVFRQLEQRVGVVDVNVERARAVAAAYDCSGAFARLEDAPLREFDAAVIATPADSHVPFARSCAEMGLALLVEKPLAAGLEGVDDLRTFCASKKLPLAVAYVLRFHPVVTRLRQLLLDRAAGHIRSLQCVCAHHLAVARPDYARTYFGHRAMGGGVIFDLSHELNYAEWLLGPLELDDCRAAVVPELGVATEGMADLLLHNRDGVRVNIHLHAADWSPRRLAYAAGSQASIEADLLAGTLRLHGTSDERVPDEREWRETVENRDRFYLDQARAFIDAIQRGVPVTCTAEEASQTLKICLQALKQGFDGQTESGAEARRA